MSSTDAPADETTRYGASGVAHYTDPGRRDPVKVRWEEPASLAFLDAALARTAAWTDRPSVVDVGCGIGDGLDHVSRLRPAGSFAYLGFDPDPDMVAAGRAAHRDAPDAVFAGGDVRTWDWDAPVDVVHSCGVPWSHVTGDELVAAVGAIARGVRARGDRTVLVLDVLGRWSAEWPDRWSSPRWHYVMSFFAGSREGPVPTAEMTTWDGDALEAAVHDAAAAAGVAAVGVVRRDRAIGVGRHADSGQHASLAPGLRGAVGGLLGDGVVEVPVDALLLPERTPADAPPAVGDAWAAWIRAWNGTVRTAREPAALFEALVALERDQDAGRGLGHTLMLAVTLDGRADRPAS